MTTNLKYRIEKLPCGDYLIRDQSGRKGTYAPNGLRLTGDFTLTMADVRHLSGIDPNFWVSMGKE